MRDSTDVFDFIEHYYRHNPWSQTIALRRIGCFMLGVDHPFARNDDPFTGRGRFESGTEKKLRDSIEVFRFIQDYCQRLYAQYREAQRRLKQGEEDHPEVERRWKDQEFFTGWTMVDLRAIGRFMLGIQQWWEYGHDPFTAKGRLALEREAARNHGNPDRDDDEDPNYKLWRAVVDAFGESARPCDIGCLVMRTKYESRLAEALYEAFDKQPHDSDAHIAAQLQEQFPGESRAELERLVGKVRFGLRTTAPRVQ